MQSISDIKKIYSEIGSYDKANLELFIKDFSADDRAGVRDMVEKAEKKLELYDAEVARSIKMLENERKYYDEGVQYICGIDEVGRGPLAGPVVACAVILPKDEMILGLNDSKQLSKAKREELYEVIMDKAVCCEIGMASEKVIDDINILQATFVAMREAISKLKIKPDILLNDAVHIPEVDIRQVPIIKGDAKSASIAAASIVAKVTRDRIMAEYDELYPGYNFAKHSAYGVPKHVEAIKRLGPCPIHRRTFITNIWKE